MAQQSDIEWTDGTWPIVQGCSYESPGCKNCYAVPLVWRLAHNPLAKIAKPLRGLVEERGGHRVWTGKVALRRDRLDWPLKWKKPQMIFVPSHGDLFHEDVPDEFIDKVFAVMALTPRHTYQVLTKRAARMRQYFEERWQGTPARRYQVGKEVFQLPAGGETGRFHQVEAAVIELAEDLGLADPDNDALWNEKGEMLARQFAWPLPNVWLGVSVEDQRHADERIPHLLAAPAAKRFISAEPLLSGIDLTTLCPGHYFVDAMSGTKYHDSPEPSPTASTGKLDWVIAGGESGPGARPMHPDWVRDLRSQCARAGVPFFFKQWGDWCPYIGRGAPPHRFSEWQALDATWVAYRIGKKAAGAMLDGVEHRAMP